MASLAEKRRAAAAAFGGGSSSSSTSVGNDSLEEQYKRTRTFVEGCNEPFRDEIMLVDFLLFLIVFYSLAGESQAQFYDKYASKHYATYPFEIDLLFSVRKDEMKSKVLNDQQQFKVKISRVSRDLLVEFLSSKAPNLLSLLNKHLLLDSSNQEIPLSSNLTTISQLVSDAEKLSAMENNLDGFAATTSKSARQQQEAPIKWAINRRIRAHQLGQNAVAFFESSAPSNRFTPESEPSTESAFYKNYIDKLLPPPPPVPASTTTTTTTSAPTSGTTGSGPATKKVKTSAEEKFPSIAMMSFLDSMDNLICIATSSSDQGKCVAAGFEDSTARVFIPNVDDSPFGLKSHVLIGHSQPVYAVSVLDGKVLTSSGDGQTRFWTLDETSGSFRNMSIYGTHGSSPIFANSFGPFGQIFATGGRGGPVKLYSLEYPDDKPMRIFHGHLGDVDCVAFHPNSHYLLSGSVDKTVRVWDIQSGKCLRVLTGMTAGVEAITCDPTGRFVACGGADGLVLVFDLSNGKRIRVLDKFTPCDVVDNTNSTDPVLSLSWSQDGAFLAASKREFVTVFPMNWIYSGEEDSIAPASSNDILNYRTFRTKCNLVVHVNFVRPDVILAGGLCGEDA